MERRASALLQLGILGLLGAGVLMTLLLPSRDERKGRKTNLELSVLIRNTDSQLWANARLGMEQAASDLGAELRFLIPVEENSLREQLETLHREVEQGTDALVLTPADTEGFLTYWEDLTEQVPVVTLESELSGAAGVVSPDHEALGRSLAQRTLEDYQGGKVLLLNTAQNSQGIQKRVAAAQALLEEQGVEVMHWDGQQQTLSALLQGGEVTQLIALERVATEEMVKAQDELGTELPLYGVGATQGIVAALEDGQLVAIGAWSEYAAGYLAVEAAAQAARGKEIKEETVLPFFIIEGREIYEPDYQKLLFPVVS